jgi:two-component system, OmpR family, sensor histidine kinase KdpD
VNGDGELTDRGARLRAVGWRGVAAVVIFIVTTIVVWVAESTLPIDDASPVYLVAVVASASLLGTTAGIATAIAAFVAYDFLFTEPRFTFIVASSADWLDLLLFLFVAVVVGRLTGLATDRAASARDHAAEAEALARISRELATRPVAEALPDVATLLAADLHVDRVWIDLEDPSARTVADTMPGAPKPVIGRIETLNRGGAGRWIVSRSTSTPAAHRGPHGSTQLRVRIEGGAAALGAIVAMTTRGLDVGRAAPRLLGLAADLVALAIERDRLETASADAEIARRADAMRTRLLTSVSHDLRTPLAAIRAASGTILDPTVPAGEARDAAAMIDDEAERLDRMVRGLLDLGRIEAGALHVSLDACDLAALVDASLGRLGRPLAGRDIEVAVGSDLPPVVVDEVLFDHLLGNLIENVVRHAPAPAPMRISAHLESGAVVLVVEDGGPGLPAGRAARAFTEPTAQRPFTQPRDVGGTGVGLMVVRAFAGAMSIDVTGAASELGGFAVTLRIPTAALPPDESVA